MSEARHSPRRTKQAGSLPLRRGSVLVLVMTVLGLLFVTGVAFMATMSFEADLIQAQSQRSSTRPAVADVAEQIDSVVKSLTIGDGPTAAALVGSPTTYAEMPGVHNLFAPLEPYQDPLNKFWLLWATDLEALTERPFEGSEQKLGLPGTTPDFEPLNTTWQPGVEPASLPGYVPLDADGDGIVDSIQVDLASLPGVDRRRLAALAQILNPPTLPDGHVWLGVRIVPHGGMVDLNASHPFLVENVIGHLDTLDPPYSPAIEEPSLRRRNFLPPAETPPTKIQGNVLSADPLLGEGDFSAELFSPGTSLDSPRYWPFDPNETGADPAIPLWAVRMDPRNWNADPTKENFYDRRHLTTTISHSDLLRRPTPVGPENERQDLTDLVLDKLGANAIDRFPYLDYPFDDPNEPSRYANRYTGSDVNFDRFDWTVCQGEVGDCSFNPRKGKLKLSLPWLQEALDRGWIDDTDRIRLIQDAFTLILLNARGSQWGQYRQDTTNKNGPSSTVTYWAPNYDAIARTAASLTANMLDFADADDFITEVEIRSANPFMANFGQPTGEFVFGLEQQPFITEVIALVDPNDPTMSSFGVELFNPYTTPIQRLTNYAIRVAGTVYTFPIASMAGGEFIGFFNGNDTALSPTKRGRTELLTGFNFKDSDTIELIRLLPSGRVAVVDRFKLAGTGVAKSSNDGFVITAQRRATPDPTGRWYAPIPLPTNTTTTVEPTLGKPNDEPPNWGEPLELRFANAGSLTDAFPTTGSLLMLMRVANSTGAAFNENLSNVQNRSGEFLIDNGRMPVFDESPTQSQTNKDGVLVNGYQSHHIDPLWDLTTFDPGTGTLGSGRTEDQAGGLMHLPWGQLVFDYFTALPLDNAGPYDGKGGIDFNARPKVDRDGVRVHGQIDINAAPWKVLEGLPIVAENEIPAEFRLDFVNTIYSGGGRPTDPNLPGMIGGSLAKAIVGYRELREVGTNGGDYSNGEVGGAPTAGFDGRGWMVLNPAYRRGTGFMSVGELANVRHRGVFNSDYRVDVGVVDENMKTGSARSYVEAIALLASLGDWMSVRSHVMTVYGTLRGDPDDDILDPQDRTRDVDSRALRFQETVDRLPLLLGQRESARIGERVIAKSNNFRGD